ncbi:C39 family peptidase [Enterococcus mundtii]|uniref:Peptidase C39 n=1 Tax=Enterococcus mundtii TaxID=53346 RepID=A0A2T5D919_ENTMU|nr:C39 family peptidase [Enterococcus mundtii]MBE6173094.1 peptidase C39 [Enterococcus faecium]MBO1085381.1 peptidase C39 [Enterococcus mundtii]MDV7745980.1 C39 family peptidase [Enterococcus mundtii]OBS62782.1 peptidase C39 [Enterococcus mundtii]PQC27744.1 peptidase C39 [Enterococcus mundtii]
MSKQKSKKRLLLGGAALVLFSSVFYFTHKQTEDQKAMLDENVEQTIKAEEKQVLLDVPLENQFDEPALENGCEVTALSMLLRFYGYETTKNQLAEQLNYVPVFNADGTHGDPNEGFVGEIWGGDWAMGVYVPPIATLAQEIVQTDYHTEPQTDANLTDIKTALKEEKPVWASVTIDFQVPTENDFMTWTTANGEVQVTPLVHACVVTGYDDQSIYVNDPYGIKNRAVPIDDFEQVFTAMGGQMLTLEKN